MKALVTGCAGQDGHYLVPYLQSLGYEVIGGYRRSSSAFYPDCERVLFDLTEFEGMRRAIRRIQPDEIYNLAAQSHVGESFACPLHTFDVNAVGVQRLLELVRETSIAVYQASTSEMFGGGTSLDERSPFRPRSPYAVAKLAAHEACRVYRTAHGIRVSSGFLFNHESPLRGREFVTRKICWHLARQKPFTLANVTSRRDWGYAGDYVRAMHAMLQTDPDDFVIATGKSHSIAEFVAEAEKHVPWRAEYSIVKAAARPWDVTELEGNAEKARQRFGFAPSMDFAGLVACMMTAEIEKVARTRGKDQAPLHATA